MFFKAALSDQGNPESPPAAKLSFLLLWEQFEEMRPHHLYPLTLVSDSSG